MIPIPGLLIALATFPGVIVHEAAHMLFCRLRGVAIFKVCFFRVGNPAGHGDDRRRQRGGDRAGSTG